MSAIPEKNQHNLKFDLSRPTYWHQHFIRIDCSSSLCPMHYEDNRLVVKRDIIEVEYMMLISVLPLVCYTIV